jgi:hypothetical protein
VQQARPILDRLATKTDADVDALRAAAIDRLAQLRFPAAPSPTTANVPLIF